MRCVVTGANGFMGSHVVRALAAEGYDVVAAVGSDIGLENLAGLDIEVRRLDVLDADSVNAALAGAEAIFHTAAIYSFWERDPELIYRVNVEGTRAVLDAAIREGARRVVYTSSTATLAPVFGRQQGDEDDVFDMRTFQGHYKVSKVMAEVLALRAAAAGLPLSVVHPTTVLGSGDLRPTPTGGMIVHFLRGHMKAYADAQLNLVDVDDVARGQVLALEKGRPGERYILGGDNLSMREVVAMLSELTGLPGARVRIPPRMLLVAGAIGEWIADHVTHRTPLVDRESALHNAASHAYSSDKAERDLGYRPVPARTALAHAVRWFLDQGVVGEARRARIEAHGALAAALAQANGRGA